MIGGEMGLVDRCDWWRDVIGGEMGLMERLD